MDFPPQKPTLRARFSRLPLLGKLGLGCGVPLLLLCVCVSGLAAWGSTLPKPASTPTPVVVVQITVQPKPSATAQPSPTPTLSPTARPSPTPSPTPKPIYPPTSVADLHALAAKGDASKIFEFHSEGVGLPSCPQPKREVLVDPSITGQQLAEDLLAYFYAQQLDNPCGALVLAYHNMSEAGNAYTAGSILIQTDNTDPNNTKAQRTLTLFLGAAVDPNLQAYSVTYT